MQKKLSNYIVNVYIILKKFEPITEKSNYDYTWIERKCHRLKAFLHDDVMNNTQEVPL